MNIPVRKIRTTFSADCCNGAWGSYFKPKEGRFKLDTRKNFLAIWMAKHWNRQPREVVDTPSLELISTTNDSKGAKIIYKALTTGFTAVFLKQCWITGDSDTDTVICNANGNQN